MSPTGNKLPTDSFNPATPKSALLYMIARTSRWQLDFLFQTFLHDKPVEIILDVQVRRRAISWDLKAIHHLRRCLRAWVQDQVPGDAIGAFLVHILYEQDYHLDYKLTTMVREHQTQLHIARRVLAFYQIRDEAGNSLWDRVAVYPDEGAAKTAPKTATELPPPIPAKEVADPRWPLFLNGLSDRKLDEITEKLGQNGELVDEKDLLPLFNGISEKDIPIIQALRRFNIHSNDFSDNLLQPHGNKTAMKQAMKQPIMLQDKPLPLPICPSRKPLPIHPTDKTLPLPPTEKTLPILSTEKPLPLPPLKRVKALISETVRVRTFNVEKKPKIRFAPDTKPGMAVIANTVQKKKTHPSSSAPLPKPSVDLDKALPPTPSDPDFGTTPWDYNKPAPSPVLKRKGGVEDFRKARQSDT